MLMTGSNQVYPHQTRLVLAFSQSIAASPG
jgi:hypothetical protein